MKVVWISAVIIFSVIHSANSQTFLKPEQKNYNKDYWSIEYSGGLSVAFIDRTEKLWYINRNENVALSGGWNAGFELTGGIDSVLGIVLSSSYTSLFTANSSYNNYSYLEVTLGPRFFHAGGKQKYFIEGGLGNYMVFKSAKPYSDQEGFYYYGDPDAPYVGMGFNLGAGVIYPLSDNIGLLLKAKLHYALPLLKSLMYANLQTGIVFGNINNSKFKPVQTTSEKEWSFTLAGGVLLPIFTKSGDYITSGNMGIELAHKPWQSTEIVAGMNYSHVVSEHESFRGDNVFLIDVSVGPRFYVFGNNTRFFAETCVDFVNYTREYYSSMDSFTTGINLGSGVNQKITDYISLVLKGNLHTLFSETYYPAAYFTATGGIKLTI